MFGIKPSLGVIAANSHQIFTVKFCPTSQGRVERHSFTVHMNDSDKYSQVTVIVLVVIVVGLVVVVVAVVIVVVIVIVVVGVVIVVIVVV